MTTDNASRRAFLGGAARLSLLGGAAPFALNLAAVGAASAQSAADYKAMVCVFLFGGNDCANTVIPYDPAAHATYRNARLPIARDRATLVPLAVEAGKPPLALPPELASFAGHFNAGRAAVSRTSGPLVEPVTQAQHRRRLGGAAGQAVLAQRPAVDLAGQRDRGRAVRLGRADRRPGRLRQRQPDLHLHVDLRQYRLALRPGLDPVPGVAGRRGRGGSDRPVHALRLDASAGPARAADPPGAGASAGARLRRADDGARSAPGCS